MTRLLQEAFERVSKLPQEEQNKIARFLLAALESDQRWAELFARPESEDLLDRIADKTLAVHRAGRTRLVKIENLKSEKGPR